MMLSVQWEVGGRLSGKGRNSQKWTPEKQNFLWESALLAVIFRFNFKLVEDELGTRLWLHILMKSSIVYQGPEKSKSNEDHVIGRLFLVQCR
jgi:hypothetical protein